MLKSILLQPWLEDFANWWYRNEAAFWNGVLIYTLFFMITELIVHEFGHYYFQRRFGIGVAYFKIGIFNLYTKTLANGTKLIIGIPAFMAESRGVGELGASEEEKNQSDAFYHPDRHPRERFLVAIGGALAVFVICAIILFFYGLGYWLFGISMSKPLLFCFSFSIINQLFNALVPLRFNKKYATDGWIAAESLIAWYKWNKKKR